MHRCICLVMACCKDKRTWFEGADAFTVWWQQSLVDLEGRRCLDGLISRYADKGTRAFRRNAPAGRSEGPCQSAGGRNQQRHHVRKAQQEKGPQESCDNSAYDLIGEDDADGGLQLPGVQLQVSRKPHAGRMMERAPDCCIIHIYVNGDPQLEAIGHPITASCERTARAGLSN